MSQHNVTTCLAKRVAEHFTSPLGVRSEFCQVVKRLDSVFVTSTVSSLINEIDDVYVSLSNGLFASARNFKLWLADSYFLALAACLWRRLDTNGMTQGVPRR